MTTTLGDAVIPMQGDSALRSAERVLPLVFDLVAPSSVVDVGCGDGAWLSVAKRLGVGRVLGLDSAEAPAGLRIESESYHQVNLSRIGEIPGPFELAMCLEVADRLAHDDALQLVEALCDSSDVVLFSSAIPGQTGSALRNEQWPPFWEALFATLEFRMVDCLRTRLWDDPNVDPCYAQNAMLYVRRSRLVWDTRLQAARDENGLMPLCAVHPGMFHRYAKPQSTIQPEPRPSLPTPRHFEAIREG